MDEHGAPWTTDPDVVREWEQMTPEEQETIRDAIRAWDAEHGDQTPPQ